jgi:hypothetical protein
VRIHATDARGTALGSSVDRAAILVRQESGRGVEFLL